MLPLKKCVLVCPPLESIHEQRNAYKKSLPCSDSTWPADVRVLYDAIQNRLFDPGVRIGEVRQACGIGDHNISCRFKHHIGMSPKAYVLHHRIALAKQLLVEYSDVSISQIGYSIGFSSASALTKAFKRRVGMTPAQFREKSRDLER